MNEVKNKRINQKVVGLLLFFMVLFQVNVHALLHVSYDPTRELYQDINQGFSKHNKVEISQSHGGSGKQARAVIDGLQADVVSLALAYDIDAIAEKGLIDKNWQSRLPNQSTPFYSTIVLLVRKNNPQNIKDWSDLTKPNVKIITPNPKTSGGARWNYLAAWGFAHKLYRGDTTKIESFMTQLFQNVLVMDTGARGSSVTFTERQLGDVLICWENEAVFINSKFKDQYQIIYPSISIKADTPVAWVDAVVKKNKTEKEAKAYLQYLYTPEAQEIAVKHFFRPTEPNTKKKYQKQFKAIPMLSVQKDFEGWQQAQKRHFADGGTFDKVSIKK